MDQLQFRLHDGFFEKANRLFSGKNSILIALSGGPDSVCLFALLCEYAKSHKVKLYAAHVNHCIRGAEADGDEEFVRKLCNENSVKLFVKKADVPKVAAESGKTVEEAARDIRYEFFDELCEKHGIDCTATAHNLSDLCETAIFNLARGSGISGLKGIKEIRGNVIRPLLDYAKSEITEYCDKNGIDYCIDRTNSNTDYTRNHIRHNIIPELYKINPEAQTAVKRCCDAIAEADDLIESLAFDYILANVSEGAFSYQSFSKLHIAVKKRVISILYSKASQNNGMLTSSHIESAVKFIENSSSGKRIPFPEDISLLREFDCFRFVKNSSAKTDIITALREGQNKFFSDNITVTSFIKDSDSSPDIVYTLFKQAFFDSDKIIGELYVRTRHSGDVIFADGMTKNVKEFFINKKIPISERGTYPIVCDGEGIIWVPQMCVADRVKISAHTNNVKTIKII